ncbi:MAG: hypothetical protein ACYS6W_16095 [Planctomycetota bacterium]|jgi:hypothetical protein
MAKMTPAELKADEKRITRWLLPQRVGWPYQEDVGMPVVQQTSQYGRVSNLVWLMLEQERMRKRGSVTVIKSRTVRPHIRDAIFCITCQEPFELKEDDRIKPFNEVMEVALYHE